MIELTVLIFLNSPFVQLTHPTQKNGNQGIRIHNSGVRLCDLETEQECSELAEHALIVRATC